MVVRSDVCISGSAEVDESLYSTRISVKIRQTSTISANFLTNLATTQRTTSAKMCGTHPALSIPDAHKEITLEVKKIYFDFDAAENDRSKVELLTNFTLVFLTE